MFDVEHAVGQHLVVVHDVEVPGTLPEQSGNPLAEGLGLGKASRAHREELFDVDEVAELAELGDPEGIRLAIEIQTGNLGESDALIEIGVGLA